jgi:hypothetical protein
MTINNNRMNIIAESVVKNAKASSGMTEKLEKLYDEYTLEKNVQKKRKIFIVLIIEFITYIKFNRQSYFDFLNDIKGDEDDGKGIEESLDIFLKSIQLDEEEDDSDEEEEEEKEKEENYVREEYAQIDDFAKMLKEIDEDAEYEDDEEPDSMNVCEDEDMEKKPNHRNKRKFDVTKEVRKPHTLTELINFLKNKHLNLYQVDFESKDTLLYGVPQGGKSAFTFANAAIQMEMGKSCVFVVRNYVKDAIHMIEKSKRFSNILTDNNFKSFQMIYGGVMSCSWCENEEGVKYVSNVSNSSSIEKALFGKKKKIVIVLANVHQLSALNFILEKRKADNLMLFVDEADAIAYGLQDIPTNIEFNKLKATSKQKFEITATPWDNLAGNETLENQNIVVLQAPPTYKGIRNVEMHDLQYPINKFKGNLIEEDPNLILFYEQLSGESVFSAPYVSKLHPIIVLHKTSTSTIHHDAFFNFFRHNYDNWVTIKEDSTGMFMFSKVCKGKNIKIDSFTFSDTNNNGVFEFKDRVIIPQILQWMIDNGGAKVFPHIVIKSGRFSGRSRSYVSSDGNWHLTHQYYFGAPNVPSLIQEMRIVHDRPDAIPLKCFAPEKVNEAIQKGAIMLDEQIERLIDKNIQRCLNVRELVRNGVWNPEKVPKKVKLTVGLSNKGFNVKKTKKGKSDGGWSFDVYEELLNERIKEHDGSEEHKWKRDESGRLNRKDGETCVELLRRSIKTYLNSEKGKSNTWKTAKEWMDITGLCGFKKDSSYHFAIMTCLINENFLERKDNKLRLKK